MKKFLSVTTTLVSILMLCLVLSACGNSSMYILPQIDTDSENISIEYADTRDGYRKLPMLDFALDPDNGIIDCVWLIKSKDKEVGWIYTGISNNINKKGELRYGIYFDKSQSINTVCYSIYLVTDDPSVYDYISISSNVGTVKFDGVSPIPGKDGKTVGQLGYYSHYFNGIEPNELKTIELTLHLSE